MVLSSARPGTAGPGATTPYVPPTCEDYRSSDDSAVETRRRPKTVNFKQADDSGYSGRTRAAMSSADPASRFSDAKSVSASSKYSKDSGYHSDPDAIHPGLVSRPNSPPSSAVKRRPTLGMDDRDVRVQVDPSGPIFMSLKGDAEGRTLRLLPNEYGQAEIVIGGGRKDKIYSLSPRKPFQWRDSVSDRERKDERRKIVVQDCKVPNCTKCVPRNQQRKEIQYHTGTPGSAVVQPAQTSRRRSSSTERIHRQPASYYPASQPHLPPPNNPPRPYYPYPQQYPSHRPYENPFARNPPSSFNSLYISNLPSNITEVELQCIFSRQPGYKRLGFVYEWGLLKCFVEFEDDHSASAAFRKWNGFPLREDVNSVMQISYATLSVDGRSGQVSITPFHPIAGLKGTICFHPSPYTGVPSSMYSLSPQPYQDAIGSTVPQRVRASSPSRAQRRPVIVQQSPQLPSARYSPLEPPRSHYAPTSDTDSTSSDEEDEDRAPMPSAPVHPQRRRPLLTRPSERNSRTSRAIYSSSQLIVVDKKVPRRRSNSGHESDSQSERSGNTPTQHRSRRSSVSGKKIAKLPPSLRSRGGTLDDRASVDRFDREKERNRRPPAHSDSSKPLHRRTEERDRVSAVEKKARTVDEVLDEHSDSERGYGGRIWASREITDQRHEREGRKYGIHERKENEDQMTRQAKGTNTKASDIRSAFSDYMARRGIAVLDGQARLENYPRATEAVATILQYDISKGSDAGLSKTPSPLRDNLVREDQPPPEQKPNLPPALLVPPASSPQHLSIAQPYIPDPSSERPAIVVTKNDNCSPISAQGSGDTGKPATVTQSERAERGKVRSSLSNYVTEATFWGRNSGSGDARTTIDSTKKLVLLPKPINHDELEISGVVGSLPISNEHISRIGNSESRGTGDTQEEDHGIGEMDDTSSEASEEIEVGIKCALDTAMNVVKALLLRELLDYALPEAKAALEGSGSSSSGSSGGCANRSSSSNLSSRTSDSQRIQRRKRTRESGRDPGDGDGDDSDSDDRPKKKNERGSPDRPPHRRLKCPFYQREPEKYTKAACRGQGFADMAKLKDHIKRVHTQPLRCSRCWLHMKSEEAYSDHLQQEIICEKKAEPQEDRIRPQTLKRLDFKKAPYANAKNVEEKWTMMFNVLFPKDTNIPSPCKPTLLGSRLLLVTDSHR